MSDIQKCKCKGAYLRRHKWNPETGKCERCPAVRNPRAKPLRKTAA